MDTVTIENVPIPERFGRGRKPKYPFNQLTIGDGSSILGPAYLLSLATNWAKRKKNGWKFICERQPDGKSRIWRTQ